MYVSRSSWLAEWIIDIIQLCVLLIYLVKMTALGGRKISSGFLVILYSTDTCERTCIGTVSPVSNCVGESSAQLDI